MMKTELWWASIGGNSCEPVRVVRNNKGDVWYSIGCTDAHPMVNGVLLVEPITEATIPYTPKEAAAAERKWQREQKQISKFCYRKFD